jgi:hypothetical protein
MRLVVFATSLAVLSGCVAPSSVPDPRAAGTAFATAAAQGDSTRIYAMMTRRARKAFSIEDVQRLVDGERVEFSEQARALTSKDVRVSAQARLRFGDGEEVTLDLRDGRFWIASAGTIPGGATTPEGALDELRRVIARRSYAGLLRLLTPATRAALEDDLKGLVLGLERPDTLHLETHGDDATAHVPGGHRVKLKREGGVWRIQDFD